ncbi:MAG: ATP-grasp ribosomal peptide maturase [Pseudonocardiaceae bacterium]
MTVLVLTHQFDPTADLVVEKLTARGVCVFRCDAADFPERLALSSTLDMGWTGQLRTARRTLALEMIGAVYYRRPSRFAFAEGMSSTERKFAGAEARLGFGGVLASLPCVWLNHPHRTSEAEYKPLQLATAARCGLSVPRTLITNDPQNAQEFAAGCPNGVVYKPLSAGPGGEQGRPIALYTSIVPPEDYGHASIARTAHLFQEWVPKRCDVRVTAVGDVLFAVEIHAQHSFRGAVDWRADYRSHEYRVTTVPEGVRMAMAALLDCLGLRFGAFDFIVTPSGDWVFLEVNPNGQWAWLEQATQLPISSAIADTLAEGSARAG